MPRHNVPAINRRDSARTAAVSVDLNAVKKAIQADPNHSARRVKPVKETAVCAADNTTASNIASRSAKVTSPSQVAPSPPLQIFHSSTPHPSHTPTKTPTPTKIELNTTLAHALNTTADNVTIPILQNNFQRRPSVATDRNIRGSYNDNDGKESVRRIRPSQSAHDMRVRRPSISNNLLRDLDMDLTGGDPKTSPITAMSSRGSNLGSGLSWTGARSHLKRQGSSMRSRVELNGVDGANGLSATRRRTTINKNRPKMPRHATQLDMLSKLKRMAPFTKDAEHEYLVNMYKLRGSYVGTPPEDAMGSTRDVGKDVTKDGRRKSVSVHMYDRVMRGETMNVGMNQQQDSMQKTTRVIEIYSDSNIKVLLPRHIGTWESFVAILVSVQVIYLPAQLAFAWDLGDSFGMLEIGVDLIFVADIFMNFNLAYRVKEHFDDEEPGEDAEISADEINKLETRRNRIFWHYVKGWFVIDFLAIIPLLLSAAFTDLDGLSFSKALRVPRLFRLLKVARVFKSMRSNNELRRFLLYSKYTSIFRLFSWILGICLLNHFIACAWWSVASESIRANKEKSDTSSDYVDAFYESVLLLNGESRNLLSNWEKIFAFFVMIVLSMFVAILFSEVNMIFSSFNSNSQKYRGKMTELYEAMESMDLPVTLQERVLQFYDFIWSKHHSLNGRTAMHNFMEELSPNLAIEIQMCTYKEMLVNVSFFREFTADVIHRLVMSLESKMFMPKDYVISVGECGTDMFFIEYGKCEVFLNHVHVRTLTKNSYFGEIALITDVRRTASVQASTYLQVVCLERDDFECCAEEMTLDSRKRVLAHILKSYRGKDILQRCSEPDFVYEEEESSNNGGTDSGQTEVNSSEIYDHFEDHDDLDHHLDQYMDGGTSRSVDLSGSGFLNPGINKGGGGGSHGGGGGGGGGFPIEEGDGSVGVMVDQRLEMVENSVHNLAAKLDKLINMNIKIMATSDMWKARQEHDKSVKFDVEHEVERRMDIFEGKKSGEDFGVGVGAGGEQERRKSGVEKKNGELGGDKHIVEAERQGSPGSPGSPERASRVTISAFPMSGGAKRAGDGNCSE